MLADNPIEKQIQEAKDCAEQTERTNKRMEEIAELAKRIGVDVEQTEKRAAESQARRIALEGARDLILELKAILEG